MEGSKGHPSSLWILNASSLCGVADSNYTTSANHSQDRAHFPTILTNEMVCTKLNTVLHIVCTAKVVDMEGPITRIHTLSSRILTHA